MLSLRLEPEQGKRHAVANFLGRIDNNQAVPLAQRGGQFVPEFETPESVRELVDKSHRLSVVACWDEAAALLQTAVAQEPHVAGLWHLLGLCHGWDGNEAAAADALHAAAKLYENWAYAVECETLAQFFDRNCPEFTVPIRKKAYAVSSVSLLLSHLDDAPQMVRLQNAGDDDEQDGPAATYIILDAVLPTDAELSQLTIQKVPTYSGRVIIFNKSEAEGQDEPLAFVTAEDGEKMEACTAIFEKHQGGAATRQIAKTAEAPGSETNADEILMRTPADEMPLHRNYYIPPATPGNVRQKIETDDWEQVLETIWLDTPQRSLQGQSPRAAIGNEELQLPLRAALHRFDFLCDRRGRMLPRKEFEQKLKLRPIEPLEISAEQGLDHIVSSLDLFRIDPTQLDHHTLLGYLDRLSNLRHAGLLYEALAELVRRPESEAVAAAAAAAAAHAATCTATDHHHDHDRDHAAEPIDLAPLVGTLSEMAASDRRFDDALAWIEHGRTLKHQSGSDPFQNSLKWKLKELRILIASFDPDRLKSLLLDLWENYATKIPQLRSQLQMAVKSLQIDPPWESSIVTASSPDNITGWTPSAATALSNEPKKLWVPGQ